jgi:hypothetical protein
MPQSNLRYTLIFFAAYYRVPADRNFNKLLVVILGSSLGGVAYVILKISLKWCRINCSTWRLEIIAHCTFFTYFPEILDFVALQAWQFHVSSSEGRFSFFVTKICKDTCVTSKYFNCVTKYSQYTFSLKYFTSAIKLLFYSLCTPGCLTKCVN